MEAPNQTVFCLLIVFVCCASLQWSKAEISWQWMQMVSNDFTRRLLEILFINFTRKLFKNLIDYLSLCICKLLSCANRWWLLFCAGLSDPYALLSIERLTSPAEQEKGKKSKKVKDAVKRSISSPDDDDFEKPSYSQFQISRVINMSLQPKWNETFEL